MAAKFSGFGKEALSFFRQLEKNNTREWFAAKKETFEEKVRTPMLELTEMISDDLRRYAVDYCMPAKKALYRIYRDTRFSKDKTPYKTHIAAHFQRPGIAKNAGAGLYFAVSHTGVDIGGGVYMPGPAELSAIRNRLADDGKNFSKLFMNKTMKKLIGELHGEQLRKSPKHFPIDHEHAELLRRKQWYFFTTLDAKTAMTPAIFKEISQRFRAMAPMVEYLNAAILAANSEGQDEDRPKRPVPMF